MNFDGHWSEEQHQFCFINRCQWLINLNGRYQSTKSLRCTHNLWAYWIDNSTLENSIYFRLECVGNEEWSLWDESSLGLVESWSVTICGSSHPTYAATGCPELLLFRSTARGWTDTHATARTSTEHRCTHTRTHTAIHIHSTTYGWLTWCTVYVLSLYTPVIDQRKWPDTVLY